MKTLYEKISVAQKSETGYHYAVLDFDNTCIINDIGDATIAYLCEHKLLKDPALLENYTGSELNYGKAVLEHYYHLIKHGANHEHCAFASRCLSGFAVDEIPDLVEKVLEHEGPVITNKELFDTHVNKGIAPRDYIHDLYKYATDHDINMWVVSASSEHIVRATISILFPKWNVRVIGIQNNITDGALGPEITLPLSAGPGKLTHIKNTIDQNIKPLFVAGDSMNDFAMLNYAQVPIVVNRNNELSEHARNNDWFMIEQK